MEGKHHVKTRNMTSGVARGLSNMKTKMREPLLMLLLFILSTSLMTSPVYPHKWNVSSTDIRIPLHNDSITVPQVSQMLYPSGYIILEPVLRDYLIFKVSLDSKFYDYCERHSQNSWNMSCTDLFCGTGDQIIENPFYHNGSNPEGNEKPLEDVLHFVNYCHYCQRSDFELYHQLKAQNKCRDETQFPHHSHCGSSHSSESGSPGGHYPLMFPPLFNTGKTSFICYCGSMDKYGYVCDAMTAFFIDFQYEGKNIIFGLLLILFIIELLITLCIPEWKVNLKKYFKMPSEKKRKLTTIRKSMFSIRQQGIMLFIFGLSFLFLEQLLAFLRSLEAFKVVAEIFVGGVFRMFSLAMIALGYSSQLVLWAGTCDRDIDAKYEIKNKYIVLLYGTYVTLVGFVLLMIVLGIFIRPVSIVWTIFAVFCMIYYFIFPVGFTAYGLKIYIELKKCQDVKITEFKFTRFMLISNLILMFVIMSAGLVLLGYIIGWDYPGEFLGFYRNIILDIISIITVVTITRFLIMTDTILEDAYNPTVSKIIQWYTFVICCTPSRKKS